MLKTKKAVIYMEVACGCCGGIINRNYRSNKSVRWLKNATNDWRWTEEYGNTCPDCLNILGKNNEKNKECK